MKVEFEGGAGPVPGPGARALADVEWPTLGLLAACYAAWGVALFWLAGLWLPVGVAVAAIGITLHSSLVHEMIHGHPTRNDRVNEALGFFSLGLCVPYRRFMELHLAHHRDSLLTDPYDDPESNYLDPEIWARLPRWFRAVLRFNNTLLGRMIVGPVLGQVVFMRADWAAIRAGDRGIARAWVLHGLGVAGVLAVVAVSPMPVWAYLVSAYLAYAILKIRTFLEHRAHERASGRTVVVEDGGPLAFLFLNNNLHVVHHMHPKVAWYRLPAMWRQNRETYLRRNGGYYYRSYAEIFARHLLRAKDPVAHPLWRRK